MFVPEHITATGDEMRGPTAGNAARRTNRQSVVEQMEVPDRITVTGGDTYGRINEDYGSSTGKTPKEYGSYLNDVPDVLTVADTQYPVEDPRREIDSARTDNSLVVEEDPIRELKNIRRQISGINGRLFQLEEINERRKTRDSFFLVGLLGVAVTAIFALVKR